VALQKQTYNSPMITFLSTPSATVTAPPTMDWTLDGEQQTGLKSVEIRCLHRAIRIVHRKE